MSLVTLIFFQFKPFKKIVFGLLDDLLSFLDHSLGAIHTHTIHIYIYTLFITKDDGFNGPSPGPLAASTRLPEPLPPGTQLHAHTRLISSHASAP
jgi:hypothetical protein